jgi:hypothetical protein
MMRHLFVRPRVARFGTAAVFSVMVLLVSITPVLATVGSDPVLSGTGVLRAQSAEPQDIPSTAGATGEASRMAAMVAVLNRQGMEGVKNLERVSAMAVPNLTVRPEFVVDTRLERAAEANAAAIAAEVSEAKVAAAEAGAARSMREATEAQVVSDTAAAAALAGQQADAAAATRASQEAAERAAQDARAAAERAAQDARTAALAAAREAEASAAVATAQADALAAAAEASNRQRSKQVLLLLGTLILLAGGVLGFRLWRNRKEPFVLKAIPVTMAAHAHA